MSFLANNFRHLFGFYLKPTFKKINMKKYHFRAFKSPFNSVLCAKIEWNHVFTIHQHIIKF